MSLLSSLRFGRGRTERDNPPHTVPSDSSTSAYPAVDPGIATRSIDQILEAHHDLLSRIKLCYGCDRATFEADLLVPIRNVAGFVNLLPATADNFYCEIGGLFRLGLEVAFFALQGTDGHIVSGRATISTRRHLEPRWRHATFLAGLCSEIHRTLSQVVVTDERGDEWPAYLGPLTAWLESRRSTRFFVRWLANAQESRALGLFALPHVLPAATMQHLATGNNIAVPQMLSCLSGLPLYREQSILVDLVKRATALVIDRDLIVSANRYGRPILGAHLERYLLDAMRRLITSHTAWAPNQERSRVWYAKEGLFVVWPNAATEIRKLLEEDELPGIPKAPDTIFEILLSAGVFEAKGRDQALWHIAPPPGKTVMEAAKLSSPDILLPSYAEFAEALPNPLVTTAPTRPNAAPPQPSPARNAAPVAPSLGPAEASAASGHGVVNDDGEITTTADMTDIPTARDAYALSSEATERAPRSQPFFKLAAPLRLNPQIRDALANAIDSLNGEPQRARAITVAAGVFIPLDHFKRARLDLPVVLRGLAELGMTAGSSSSRFSEAGTVRHEFGGQQEIGIVLKACFVDGLDPADFAPSP